MNSKASHILKFTKLSEHAFPPLKGSEKAAGFDLKRLVTVPSFSFQFTICVMALYQSYMLDSHACVSPNALLKLCPPTEMEVGAWDAQRVKFQ